MSALKDWRNREVERKGVPPVAVVSNNVLKELVFAAPRSLEAVAAIPEVRRWQVALYAETWLGIVAEVLGPERTEGEAPSEGGGRRRGRRGRRGGAGADAGGESEVVAGDSAEESVDDVIIA